MDDNKFSRWGFMKMMAGVSLASAGAVVAPVLTPGDSMAAPLILKGNDWSRLWKTIPLM